MANDYRKFDCRICGKQVFVPVMKGSTGEVATEGFLELTCSNGHTDAYEIVESNRPVVNDAPADVKAFAAYAGIG